ncbi:ComF family protein [Alicyclobacillus suci]|uniref:ComF family protein n=1 Tax=Alicyclobacillus suci TaxID=2816080 RepID=UPI001A909892|nr:phosphoribosyltransferase family protein [Alicyclobacillus suci]
MNERIAWRYRLRQLSNVMLNWVFPTDETLCVLCGRPVVEAPVVATTYKHSHAKAHRDKRQMCLFCLQDAQGCAPQPAHQQLQLQSPKRPLDVYSCIPYDHFIRNLIRAWKYDGVIELTQWFSEMAAQMLDALTETESLAFDVAVPVPSTRERTRKRGYNHVRLLLEHATSHLALRTAPALVRVQTSGSGFTQSQTAKTRADRQAGLMRAYEHNKQISVRGSRVLLMDDIVTTGATLAACAERLYHAGAVSVCAIVIARVL